MSTPKVVFGAMVFACAGMVVVYFAVGLLLVDHWQVTTSRTIASPPARIAAAVGDLSTWEQWASVDATLGPQTHRSVFGEPGTVGHGLRWTGSAGTATLTFTSVTPEAIDYEFGGEDPQQQQRPRSTGRIEWHDEGGSCRLRWHDEGTWPNLAGRWWGWFGAMQVHMQQLQSASLEGLAERVEGRKS
ncbi:MAG: SRPBCC family protein [Planctomycetes bacterium]|nr:SRPBCC family protein [Planctomycetota bacterium]